jgi:exosortase C (VPDSG-CTERM-specific)
MDARYAPAARWKMSVPDLTPSSSGPPPQIRNFALAAGLLTFAFAVPLGRLCQFALSDELFSYIPLMPAVAAYLVWTEKSQLPRQSRPARGAALAFLLGCVVATAGYWLLAHSGKVPQQNSLVLAVLGWLLGLAAAGCAWLGGAMMRRLAFPLALLLFMIPFPTAVRAAVEGALQQGSATVADGMFTVAGMPFWRQGTFFHLPVITLDVAPECSGIHSTWILFITSLVAGRMILQRGWSRMWLCLAVIPLALLRNGFRVFVLGELCVQISPRMIDSPIHHHGGPLFFILSLGPFFLLLYFLRKRESTESVTPLSKSEP